jgi:hypothetical protein
LDFSEKIEAVAETLADLAKGWSQGGLVKIGVWKKQMLDVLAIIRAPLELYPPSLHQVGLLAEAGLRVAVVDTVHSGVP